METDIGNPIEYDRDIDSLKNMDEDTTHIDEQQHQNAQYFQPQELMYQPQYQTMQQYNSEKFDLFASVDKSTWIIAFAVFLLGFFMGKTMQPVILRYT